MPTEKTRIGPILTQEDGLKVRETYLRLDHRTDLYIKEKWRPSDASLPPTVLLHGAGMDGAGYDVPVEDVSLLDALARAGSRAYAFDFRGHGRSSRVEDGTAVTVETSVTDTLAVLDYVAEVTGRGQAVLVGESFGSIVAPVVAEREPEQVAGLALLGLIYRRTGADLDEALAELARVPGGYAFTTEEEWPEQYIPSASPAVTAWHQAQFGTAYAYPVGPYLGVGQLPHLRRPERIRSHVLVVIGDLDPYATLGDTEAFLTAVSGAASTRHLRQEGVGHLPYVESQARAVQEAIIGLLELANQDFQSMM
jgi:pimeloyl-ACP methyl ester carboxylesterase